MQNFSLELKKGNQIMFRNARLFVIEGEDRGDTFKVKVKFNFPKLNEDGSLPEVLGEDNQIVLDKSGNPATATNTVKNVVHTFLLGYVSKGTRHYNNVVSSLENLHNPDKFDQNFFYRDGGLYVNDNGEIPYENFMSITASNTNFKEVKAFGLDRKPVAVLGGNVFYPSVIVDVLIEFYYSKLHNKVFAKLLGISKKAEGNRGLSTAEAADMFDAEADGDVYYPTNEELAEQYSDSGYAQDKANTKRTAKPKSNNQSYDTSKTPESYNVGSADGVDMF